ncbi:MAG: glycerate kinase [Firmicutes bacterium]|nr:glycerate kinase [Bacillota bacterium]
MKQKHIIVIPDSFKGTMTATEVCRIIGQAITDIAPGTHVTAIPMADGGEGTCDCFRYALGGEKVSCLAANPFMEPRRTYYWKKDTDAVVELAAAAGFITDPGQRNPERTTTYGVGELILHAIRGGCRRIILGLGGSCTNDGGLGIAAALGARFTDEAGREFVPTGGTIDRIRGMDLSRLQEQIRGVTFEVMCDVNNPLHGPQGAAFVFAPQKGADDAMVQRLDRNLRIYAELIQTHLGMDVSEIPGAGAAGGAGAGAVAFLGARLRPGAEIVLEMTRFDEQLASCDLVYTGEGKLDEQSLRGKVVAVIGEHASRQGVPVIAVVGQVDDGLGDGDLRDGGLGDGDLRGGDFRGGDLRDGEFMDGVLPRIRDRGITEVIQTTSFCADPARYERTCRQDLYRAAKFAAERWVLTQ